MPVLGSPANEIKTKLTASYARGNDTSLSVDSVDNFPNSPQVIRLTYGDHWCLLIYSSVDSDNVKLVMGSATDYAAGINVSSGDDSYTWPAGTIVELVSAADYIAQLQGKFDPAAGHKHTGAAGDAPTLDAAVISTGRLVLARLPDGSAGYFLQAQGTGEDPVWVLLAASDIPALDASKITTGRFPMARMPDGDSGYVLTAQGAGKDPAYAGLPPAITFCDVEIFNDTAPTDWTAIDLSSIVGANSAFVVVKASSPDSNGFSIQLRPHNGVEVSSSGMGYVYIPASNYGGYVDTITDGSGIIDLKASSDSSTIVLSVAAYIK